MLSVLLAGGLTGVLFGFILQRGRFCMTSAFRDLYLSGDATLFKAYLLALAVQSSGIFLLQGAGLLSLQSDPFQWVASLAGGFIFGVSLILSGGCASGTYYRIGEGMVGSVVAAVFYGIGALASRAGILAPLTQRLQEPTVEDGTLYATLGISPWVLVALLWAAVLGLWLRSRRQAGPAWEPPTDPNQSRLWRKVFGKGWSWQATGLAVGVAAVLAWVTSLTVGRHGGLGITTPTANLLRFLLVNPELKCLDWGVFLILGLPVGAYLSARAAGEFRLRAPGPARLLHHALGGLGMGVGATLARGCNIGNGLVAVSLFHLNGWAATAATILGTWAGAYLFLVLPARLRAAASQVPATAPSGD